MLRYEYYDMRTGVLRLWSCTVVSWWQELGMGGGLERVSHVGSGVLGYRLWYAAS